MNNMYTTLITCISRQDVFVPHGLINFADRLKLKKKYIVFVFKYFMSICKTYFYLVIFILFYANTSTCISILILF